MRSVPSVIEIIGALGLAGSGIFMIAQSLLDASPTGNGVILIFGAVFSLTGSGLVVIMTHSLVAHVLKLRWSEDNEASDVAVRDNEDTIEPDK